MSVINNDNKNSIVLIVNCLKNDDDREMARMSELIQNVLRTEGQKIVVADFTEVKNLNGLYSNVIFVSHHRFYDKDLRPIPLNQRSVGGYSLNECAKAVCKLAQENKAAYFQFYGCEMACNTDTEIFDNEGKAKLEVFSYPFRRHLYYAATHSNNEDRVSSLQYIGGLVYKNLEAERDGRSVTLRGLNGVGFIKAEHNAKPWAFNQRFLHELVNLESRERLVVREQDAKGQKKLIEAVRKTEQEFFEKRVQNKPSPHQIEFVVTVDF